MRLIDVCIYVIQSLYIYLFAIITKYEMKSRISGNSTLFYAIARKMG